MIHQDAALLWLDLETTGLDPHEGQILEVGLRITNSGLETLAESSWVVHFDRADLSNLSDFILAMHTKNGLLFDCMKSDLTIDDVARHAQNWVWNHLPLAGEQLPMAGSTVSFDRSWLKHHAIEIDNLAHYRSFDVSSIKLAARMWMPNLPHFKDRETHRVLPDIEDSIQELSYYVYNGVLNGWAHSKRTDGRKFDGG